MVLVGSVSQDAPVCECSVACERLTLLLRLGRALPQASLAHLPLWEPTCCSPACSSAATFGVARRC